MFEEDEIYVYKFINGSTVIGIEVDVDEEDETFFAEGLTEIITNDKGQIGFRSWMFNDPLDIVPVSINSVIARAIPSPDLLSLYLRIREEYFDQSSNDQKINPFLDKLDPISGIIDDPLYFKRN